MDQRTASVRSLGCQMRRMETCTLEKKSERCARSRQNTPLYASLPTAWAGAPGRPTRSVKWMSSRKMSQLGSASKSCGNSSRSVRMATPTCRKYSLAPGSGGGGGGEGDSALSSGVEGADAPPSRSGRRV